MRPQQKGTRSYTTTELTACRIHFSNTNTNRAKVCSNQERMLSYCFWLQDVFTVHRQKNQSHCAVRSQKATEQDPVIQTLKTTILTGWPTQREEVPIHVREF